MINLCSQTIREISYTLANWYFVIFKETTYNIYNLPNVQQAAMDCTEVEFVQRSSSA